MKLLNKPSLRQQLLLWLIIPTIILGILGSYATYQLAKLFANEAYDESLVDTARALASRLHFSKTDKIEIDLPPAAKALLEYDNQDRFFYQIIGTDGLTIAGDPNFVKPPKTKEIIYFWDANFNGEKIRIATVRTPVEDGSSEDVIIQVAETFEGRTRHAAKILLSVICLQILFAMLSTCVVWFGVSRGLIPLEKIRKAVLQRSQKDLTPLDEQDIPAEIQPLTEALNHLLKMLSNDLEIKRRFIANAAHQLRTPLAGLKTHAELAVTADNPKVLRHSLQQLQTSIDRTIHVANQLLSLARTEPGAMNSQSFQILDFGKLVRDVTRELVPQALPKNIDLGFEGKNEAAPVNGDRVALKELVTNLVENAIRYSPDNSSITVSLEVSQNDIDLVVEDNGIGIPIDERNRVFERFYRVVREQADGSGLGLSIVKDIADAHDAEIQILDGTEGRGTKVTVAFPKALIGNKKC